MGFQIEIDKKIKDGSIYFVGDALPPDWYAAFKSWSLLADQGDMKAQLNIGWCYLCGEGTEINKDQSKTWFLKAASQNCPKANWYLSRKYFDFDENTRKAFFEKAFCLGDKLALQHKENEKKKGAEQEKKIIDEKNRLKKQEEAEIYQAKIKRINAALDDKKYDEGKLLLDAAIADGHANLQIVRAAFDVSVKNMEVIQESRKGDLVKGGIVNGTTQTYQEIHRFLNVSYTLINDSSFPAQISLRYLNETTKKDGEPIQGPQIISPGESKTSSVTFSPNRASSLLPFTLHYVDGNYFRVPLKKHKKTIFPSCEYALAGGSGCFVLTACYGDASHPVVTSFRNFRDYYLSKYIFGRIFINLYYKYGPSAAHFIKDKPVLRKGLRLIFSFTKELLPKFIENKH